MQVVVQRVSRASVAVGGDVVGEIGAGLFALVGVGHDSTADDARWLAAKIEGLRVFPAAGVEAEAPGAPMDASVADIGGGVLAISQFTLYGDVRKGRRPSFVHAAAPGPGEELYRAYCDALTVPTARGVFGADMRIDAVADGPVTLVIEREGT